MPLTIRASSTRIFVSAWWLTLFLLAFVCKRGSSPAHYRSCTEPQAEHSCPDERGGQRCHCRRGYPRKNSREATPATTADQPDHLEIVNVLRDDLFKVLFTKNGTLYVVTTLPEYEAWLTNILTTWQFTD